LTFFLNYFILFASAFSWYLFRQIMVQLC
jgi:hypothetical protein